MVPEVDEEVVYITDEDEKPIDPIVLKEARPLVVINRYGPSHAHSALPFKASSHGS